MDEQLGTFKVVKPHGCSFHVGRQRMELVLAYRELDDRINDEPPNELDEDFKTWKRSDTSSRAIIGPSLSAENLDHVRDVKR